MAVGNVCVCERESECVYVWVCGCVGVWATHTIGGTLITLALFNFFNFLIFFLGGTR
jgi:hypothetical protein